MFSTYKIVIYVFKKWNYTYIAWSYINNSNHNKLVFGFFLEYVVNTRGSWFLMKSAPPKEQAWGSLHTPAKGHDHDIARAFDSHPKVALLTWYCKGLWFLSKGCTSDMLCWNCDMPSYLFKVSMTHFHVDHEIFSIVRHVRIHVTFSSM